MSNAKVQYLRKIVVRKHKFNKKTLNLLKESPRIMFVTPNIVGFSGDAVNERQLAKALSKYSVVEIYSLIPLLRLQELKRADYLKDFRRVVLVPVIAFPYFVGTMLTLIVGFLYALVAVLRGSKLIYVRSSVLALPFLWLKKLHGAMVVVKIPAIVEDEIGKSDSIKSFGLDLKLFLWVNSLADRYVLANGDRVAVPSPLLYVELCKRRVIKNPRPPIIVPAGVDLEKVGKIIKSVKGTKIINKEEFTIGFVGLIEWWQGVDILVKSLHILSQKCMETNNYKLRLLIVGNGPLRGRVEKLCRELNVNCVITGFVSHEDALKLMSSLDVLVLPRLKTSATESNVPIKVIEAWALGVPVIITRHRIFEVLGLKDGEDLIYCEPYPSSVAEAICRLIKEPTLKLKLASAGPRLAEMFNYNRIAYNLLEVIRRK